MNNKFCILALALFVSGAFTSCIDCGKPQGSDKLTALLHVIGTQYVDTVDMDALVEKTIPKVLVELDPHSVYIPAKDAEEANQDLRGSFSGIGIQFMIQADTIYVSDVISGGPAEKVGLMAGDRIVTIDDSLYVGKKINNDGAMKRLKGPKGSEVRLGIKRFGEKELLHYTIVRGNIPVKSVDATYMIDDRWCYIKANKFGETTYPEMLIALAQGIQKGMQGCIIDLRGNTGGYMGAAIQMVKDGRLDDMVDRAKNGEFDDMIREFAGSEAQEVLDALHSGELDAEIDRIKRGEYDDMINGFAFNPAA